MRKLSTMGQDLLNEAMNNELLDAPLRIRRDAKCDSLVRLVETYQAVLQRAIEQRNMEISYGSDDPFHDEKRYDEELMEILTRAGKDQ